MIESAEQAKTAAMERVCLTEELSEIHGQARDLIERAADLLGEAKKTIETAHRFGSPAETIDCQKLYAEMAAHSIDDQRSDLRRLSDMLRSGNSRLEQIANRGAEVFNIPIGDWENYEANRTPIFSKGA